MNPFLRWATKILRIFRPAQKSPEVEAEKAPGPPAPVSVSQAVDNPPPKAEKKERPAPSARVTPKKEKQEIQPVFTGRVEPTPALDNPARLRQIKGVISINDIVNRELLD